MQFHKKNIISVEGELHQVVLADEEAMAAVPLNYKLTEEGHEYSFNYLEVGIFSNCKNINKDFDLKFVAKNLKEYREMSE